MHEMSIAMELMDQLEALAAEHDLALIESVSVQAGVLRGIVPEAMQIAFAAASAGGCAANATLELEIVPAEAKCRLCARSFEPGIASFLCPGCGEADVELVQGDDIILASVAGQQREGEEAS